MMGLVRDQATMEMERSIRRLITRCSKVRSFAMCMTMDLSSRVMYFAPLGHHVDHLKIIVDILLLLVAKSIKSVRSFVGTS